MISGRIRLPSLAPVLHPWRHRRARRRIETSGPVETLIFVCHANVCRSPYAAEALRLRLQAQPGDRAPSVVGSIGFLSPGRPPPALAVRLAAARGVDLGGHRSATFLRRDVASAHLILVMTTRQAWRLRVEHGLSRVEHLGDLDPDPIRTRDIPDPVTMPEAAFRNVYERIDRCIEVLARSLLGEDDFRGS